MLSFTEIKAVTKVKKQFKIKYIPIYRNGTIYDVTGVDKNLLYENRKAKLNMKKYKGIIINIEIYVRGTLYH